MLFRSSAAAAALVLLAGGALAAPQSQEVFFGQPPLVQKEEILRQAEASGTGLVLLKVTGTGVRLRQGPGSSHDVADMADADVRHGEFVASGATTAGDGRQWYHVLYKLESPEAGYSRQDAWICADYVEASPLGSGRRREASFVRSARPEAAGADAGGAGAALAAVPGLADAVAAWDEAVRKAIRAFDGLSPAEADRLYASESSPLRRLEDAKAYQDADRAAQPLFARWAQSFDDARLSPADKACFAELARHGLVKAMTEGTPYFQVDQGAFEARLYARLSPAMADYARLKRRQPAVLVEDAGLLFSIGEMLGWALEWERFIQAGATGLARSQAAAQYEALMELCLFSELDNSPAFAGGRMAEDVRRGLEQGASRLKGTVTGRLAGDYLRDVRQNGWKYNKAVERRHRQLLGQAFQ